MMQFPAFDLMAQTDQLIREINILIPFILYDQKMAYEVLPFLLAITLFCFSPDGSVVCTLNTRCEH